MSGVIIFGDKDLAQLAKFYIDNDEAYKDTEVVAFTLNRSFITSSEYLGLPVVPFEDLEKIYPPDKYELFAPMTGVDANRLRESIYLEGLRMGYSFMSYISSKATLFGNEIGDNCFILENNTIQPFVKIGNNVIMWSGNHIGHHSVIEDNVFFTSHVVLSGHCTVKKNAWLGVNSTIRDGVVVGEGSLVAMSASVTKDTECWSIYMGIPAKKIGSKKSYEVL